MKPRALYLTEELGHCWEWLPGRYRCARCSRVVAALEEGVGRCLMALLSDRDGRADPPSEPSEPVDRVLERPAPNQPGGTGARCEDDGDLRQR